MDSFGFLRRFSPQITFIIGVLLIGACSDDESASKPVASLTASPLSGAAPLEVFLDASESTGDDLAVTWDFEGDGIWDSHASSTMTSTFTY
ncbi:PKD domain-containing protein, partial [Myxococcota bacterium]|nr:PKD domain-containing protein [Myxococcota bacterium]